ncbi:MAG: two-component regulator propeller domain-containing protein, partial [Bacteroidota bacterium]
MHRIRLIILLYGILFFINTVIHAAELPAKRLKFEAITINDGLSQGMINYILQDHYGFMWFATKDGLNRYDGYRFVVYRHDAADATSISDSYVTWIFEDSKGNLWLSTAGHGLDLFERSTETFIHFIHNEKNTNTISNNVVSNIAEDKFGNIWAGTDYGLNKITFTVKPAKDTSPTSFSEKYNVTITHIHFDSSNPGRELYTKKEKNDLGLHTFYIDKSGMLWVSTYEMLFNIYPSKSNDDKVVQLNVDDYFVYPFHDKGMETHAHSYVEDTVRNKLYFLASFCVTEVDLVTKKVKFISTQRNFTGFVDGQAVLDEDGILWINDSEKLLQLDIGRKQSTLIHPKDITQAEMVQSMNTVYKDRSGVIWLGTKGYGLLKYNPQSAKFHHTDNASMRWISILNDSLITVIKTFDFVHLYNYRTGLFTDTLPHKKVFDQSVFNGYGYVDAIARDTDGTYWMCKGRLLHYDPDHETLHEYATLNHGCFPLFYDHNHNIWVGTENAFSLFDKKSEKFIDYAYPIPSPNVPYSFLVSIYEDSHGIFWLGTISGILRFDPSNRTWKHYSNNPSDLSSLSFDVVFSILPDPSEPENYLWIGTNGGGLNRFDKRSEKFVRITEKDGLPNNVIYGILSDENKNLWLSTNKGISCYSITTGTFKNFEAKDGLQSNEFNRHAFCKSADGILFFGGVNGFNYFDPKDLKKNPFIPRINITDIKLKNQSIYFKDKNSAINNPAYLIQQLKLPYHDNVITFEFASMEYSATDKNEYQYMMEGFDKEWIQAGTNHSATYTNLDPGNYTFRVKGSNNDGVWNEAGTSVQLTILPPWYMTWWFRVLVVVAIATAVYILYRYRLKQILKMQSLRNRIASDLHDEIGSTLSSISLFGEVARKNINNNPAKADNLLEQINEYTSAMMDSMGDIVWTINTRNDSFDNLINRMRAFSSKVMETREVNFVFNASVTGAIGHLDMTQRKNVYLIFKEAVNNAAKYSCCKNLKIEVTDENSLLKICIKDDGNGFDTEALLTNST